jgi:hypothetical protein
MIYKNAQENIHGSIDCLILVGSDWVPTTQDPALEYELSEESDWQDIKSCDQDEKDAYQAQLVREDILSQIAALDVPPYTIGRACAGDQTALDKIVASEAAKQILRGQL